MCVGLLFALTPLFGRKEVPEGRQPGGGRVCTTGQFDLLKELMQQPLMLKQLCML
jgi:hypothetical protein